MVFFEGEKKTYPLIWKVFTSKQHNNGIFLIRTYLIWALRGNPGLLPDMLVVAAEGLLLLLSLLLLSLLLLSLLLHGGLSFLPPPKKQSPRYGVKKNKTDRVS